MRKTWWLEARKDFTYRGRSHAAGEVFQELVPIAAHMVFKKWAKKTAEPQVPAVAPAVVDEPAVFVDADPVVEPEPEAVPAAAPDQEPDAQDKPEEPETVTAQESPARAMSTEAMPTRRWNRRRTKTAAADAD